ncbi:hypothetical protein LINPERHAP1_LOCUS39581 [Linum perenne]
MLGREFLKCKLTSYVQLSSYQRPRPWTTNMQQSFASIED